MLHHLYLKPTGGCEALKAPKKQGNSAHEIKKYDRAHLRARRVAHQQPI
jgi:hypothetical protein